MTWFVTLLFVILTFDHLSEANHLKKKKKHTSEIVVVGKVYCDTCFQDHSHKTGHFISDAKVVIECNHDGSPDTAFRGEATTGGRGEFRVRLPPSARTIKACSVKLIKSGEPYCAATTSSSSQIHLKSKSRGIRVFSAGLFSFRPPNQPNLCNQKPRRLKNSFSINKNKIQEDPSDRRVDTKEFFFPPNPFWPPPLVPNPFQPPPAPLIPNPFQPPPAPLIPNPFQPPPAPVLPNPFQPPPAPPAPFFPFPPVPGLTPSPPPPPPPVFPFPLPPFPFLPPRSPGTPPASEKTRREYRN